MRLLLCLALVPGLLIGGEWRSKGEVKLETRTFTDDNDPVTVDSGYGLFTRLETRYRHGPWRIKLRGFGRLDERDDSRDLVAIQEAWVGWRKSGWDVRLGFNMLNWTATEAFHPADQVNSRNLDSNIENPEKLGELMVSAKRRLGGGALTMYYFPRYEEPNLPGPSSRLSLLPGPFEVGDALWLDDDGALSSDSYGVQYGARYSQTIGDADFSVHYLDHLDRNQPTGLFESGVFHPVYHGVRDLGLTYLQIVGSWIVKIEANSRDFQEQTGIYADIAQEDHQQVAFGLEYSWAAQTGSETALIFEGQGLFGVNEAVRAGLWPFQRDVLFGVRHAWNDVKGRELLVTGIYDLERSHEYLLNASYKQRISDVWSIEAGLRLIDAPVKQDVPIGLETLDEGNQVFVNVSRFF